MKSVALLALFLAAPSLAASLPRSGITDASLKADTAMLASDAFEGRKPGTPGGDKAVAYIQQRMAAIGLQPGNHGQWTQDVPLVTITTAPTPLTLGYCAGGTPECRAATRMNLVYGTDVVLWTKRQVTAQVLANTPVVFVGYGITAPEKGWDDYAGLDVHGKTVVFLVNDPDWQTPAAGKDAGPFEGRAMTYYGRYTYKFEEAARHGAAAAFVIHDTEPAGYGWNVITTSWTGPQIDLDQPGQGHGTRRCRGLDHPRRLRADARGYGQGPLQPDHGCADQGLPRRAAAAGGVGQPDQHHHPLGVEERRRHRVGHASTPTRRCCSPPTGTTSAAARRTGRATISAMARSTMRRASPGCSRSRRPSPPVRSPNGPSSSWR